MSGTCCWEHICAHDVGSTPVHLVSTSLFQDCRWTGLHEGDALECGASVDVRSRLSCHVTAAGQHVQLPGHSLPEIAGSQSWAVVLSALLVGLHRLQHCGGASGVGLTFSQHDLKAPTSAVGHATWPANCLYAAMLMSYVASLHVRYVGVLLYPSYGTWPFVWAVMHAKL